MRACLHEVDKARGSRNLWEWFRESRQAELVVIFGEDLAALLGLTFALIAVVMTVLTGNPLFDALGTIAIGVLLIVVAVLVAIEVKAMLIGQSVDPLLQAEISGFLKARPEIAEVLHLITLQQGNQVMVSIHARMHQAHDAEAMLADIDRVERALKQQFPVVRWSFFEPEGAGQAPY